MLGHEKDSTHIYICIFVVDIKYKSLSLPSQFTIQYFSPFLFILFFFFHFVYLFCIFIDMVLFFLFLFYCLLLFTLGIFLTKTFEDSKIFIVIQINFFICFITILNIAFIFFFFIKKIHCRNVKET